MTRRSIFLLGTCVALLLFFKVGVLPVFANERYQVRQISLAEGLSQTSVTSMVKDHEGNLWIGTRKGLNRLSDGKITVFRHHTEDIHSLPGDRIEQLLCDAHGTLWAMTNGGLCSYNGLEGFTRFLYPSGKSRYVLSFASDKEGVFFGAHQRLFYAPHDADSLSTYLELPYNVDHILPMSDDVFLLLSNQQGVFRMEVDDDHQCRLNQLTAFKMPVDAGVSELDSLGNLWVALRNGGLSRYRFQGDSLSYVSHYSVATGNLNHDAVMDIVAFKNDVWIATDGGGLSLYKPQKDVFEPVDASVELQPSIPMNSVLSLTAIDQNLWAGTVRSGALELRNVDLFTYRIPSVSSVYEDAKGCLWLGTDGGGLYSIGYSDGKREAVAKHYSATGQVKVTSVAQCGPDRLLLFIYGQGLGVFNCKSETFQMLDTDAPKIAEMTYLLNLSDGTTALLGYSRLLYDPSTDEFQKKSSDYYGRLVPIKQRGTQILCYDDYGLFLVDVQTFSVKQIYKCDQRIPAASYCAVQDCVWFGIGRQLWRYNLHNESIDFFDMPVDGDVENVFCDSKGNIWLCVANYLLLFDYVNNSFVLYDNADGLTPNEYTRTTSIETKEGNLIMGGVNGALCIMNTIDTHKEQNIESIQLQKITVDGVVKESQGKSNKILIDRGFGAMDIRLSIKKKDIFKDNLYRFTLLGPTSITLESSNNYINISHLHWGHYELQVAYLTDYGEWSVPYKVASLKVLRPIYLSHSAIILYVFAFLCAVGLFVRVRNRKNKKRELYLQRERARVSSDEKIKFLMNVSHELRTPLTLIDNRLKQTLVSDSLSKDVTEQLDAALYQTHHMTRLVNMMLDIRKLEDGGGTLNLQSVPYNDWVASVIANFKMEFASRSIQLATQWDPKVDMVFFDQEKCALALTNILVNAMKYSPPDTQVLVRTQWTDHQMVRTEVVDQGIGLKNVNTEKIFQRFYQGKVGRGGYGIGLSYAKNIVEYHGGIIGAFSNEDCGSTFFYELPVGRPQQVVEEPLPAAPIDTHQYTVLFIDDNVDLLAFLKQTFSSGFKEVFTASDAYQGLEMIRAHLPSVVVSDVVMPGKDGFALCREIKTDLTISHIPIVLLTERSDRQSQMTGYKTGADSYLTKPFDQKMLFSVLCNLLRSREQMYKLFAQPSLDLPASESMISVADERFLERLDAFIHANLSNEQLDAPMIVSHMAMSKTAFYAKIKDLTSVGIMAYVNKKRMIEASGMLSNTDIPIGEIAFSVGFADQKYFSKQFKKYSDKTPSQYRSEKTQ